MSNENRQPAGVPVGGQFATGTKAENGTELAAAAPEGTVPEDYRGPCLGCDGNVGMTEDNQVVHIDENHRPIDDADTADHEPSFDPYTYDGGAVDEVAEVSGWGSSAWEAYTDARDERNLAAATDEAFAKGKASVIGGIDLTGTAGDVRDAAVKALRQAEVVYQIAGVKDLAENILEEYPDAAYLELEDNDQEGSAFIGTRVLDGHGDHIGDMDDFEDHWAALSDLPATPQYEVTVSEDGTVTSEGDSRYAFLELKGSRRQGYTGRIDLKAAAAADLTTL